MTSLEKDFIKKVCCSVGLCGSLRYGLIADRRSLPLLRTSSSSSTRRCRSSMQSVRAMKSALECSAPVNSAEEASQRLKNAGFTHISEKEDEHWKVKPGGKYFFTRNQVDTCLTSSSHEVVVLRRARLSRSLSAANGSLATVLPSSAPTLTVRASLFVSVLKSFSILSGPVLKLKPISKASGSGYQQVAIEPYGGGLWYTW